MVSFATAPQVVRRQFKLIGTWIFLQTLQLPRSRDRHDPPLPRKQPCQCNLCRCGTLAVRNATEQIHQDQIGGARFGCEPGRPVAEIGAVKFGFRPDLARKESGPQWTEGHKPDCQFLAHGEYAIFFGIARPQRVLALHSCHGLNVVGSADCPRTCLG